MISRSTLCISALLILCLSTTGLAQKKPAWLIKIQREFEGKETDWKIEHINLIYKRDEPNPSSVDLVFRGKGAQASINISLWDTLTTAREVFKGHIIVNDDIRGATMSKKQLPNLGDECYMWIPTGGEGYTFIYFRKGKVMCSVSAPSEVIATRFAQQILAHINAI
jgi:hypothetical protein